MVPCTREINLGVPRTPRGSVIRWWRQPPLRPGDGEMVGNGEIGEGQWQGPSPSQIGSFCQNLVRFSACCAQGERGAAWGRKRLTWIPKIGEMGEDAAAGTLTFSKWQFLLKIGFVFSIACPRQMGSCVGRMTSHLVTESGKIGSGRDPHALGLAFFAGTWFCFRRAVPRANGELCGAGNVPLGEL